VIKSAILNGNQKILEEKNILFIKIKLYIIVTIAIKKLDCMKVDIIVY